MLIESIEDEGYWGVERKRIEYEDEEGWRSNEEGRLKNNGGD